MVIIHSGRPVAPVVRGSQPIAESRWWAPQGGLDQELPTRLSCRSRRRFATHRSVCPRRARAVTRPIRHCLACGHLALDHPWLGPSETAEPDVAHAGVDHLRSARRRPVAQAVAVRAQEGAALDHLARHPELRLARVVARFHRGAPRIPRCAAGSNVDLACRAGSRTSPRSTPRRSRPCRRVRRRLAGNEPTADVLP